MDNPYCSCKLTRVRAHLPGQRGPCRPGRAEVGVEVPDASGRRPPPAHEAVPRLQHAPPSPESVSPPLPPAHTHTHHHHHHPPIKPHRRALERCLPAPLLPAPACTAGLLPRPAIEAVPPPSIAALTRFRTYRAADRLVAVRGVECQRLRRELCQPRRRDLGATPRTIMWPPRKNSYGCVICWHPLPFHLVQAHNEIREDSAAERGNGRGAAHCHLIQTLSHHDTKPSACSTKDIDGIT